MKKEERKEIYALDFETHADEESKRKKETSIWLSCLIKKGDTLQDDIFDYNMNEVLSRLEKYSRDAELLIYVYNLSFEWSFILPCILERGLTWNPSPESNSSFYYNSISTKTATSVWTATIKFSSKNHKIIFRDLAKMFPGGLRNIAQDFGLETQKGEIDYTINRLHNYAVTDAEKEYCFKDCKIVLEVLEKVKDDKAFWESLSMSSYACNRMIYEAYHSYKNPYKVFRRENNYPELEEEENEFLRHTVEGGLTFVVPRYQYLDINKTMIHIDAHQMHPSSAYLNLFPYGRGRYGTGRPMIGDGISAIHAKISYSGVKLYPKVQLIGLPMATDYEIWFWSFELPILEMCLYDFRIKYIDYYKYRKRLLPWRNFYRENYEDRIAQKKKNNLFLAQLDKLKNNGSYGKLLEKPRNYKRENYITDKGLIDSRDYPADKIKNNARYTSLQVGGTIPAYSRVALIRTAFKIGWEKCVYFDTDSIFFLLDDDTKDWQDKINMRNELGGWGLEGTISHSQFTAPKRYKLLENDKLVVKTAGFQIIDYLQNLYSKEAEEGNDRAVPTRAGIRDGSNSQIEVPFDEINITSATYEVKRAYRVKGGTMVDYQKKKLDVQEKYQDIYEQNKGKELVTHEIKENNSR